jgi:hypothetical protein
MSSQIKITADTSELKKSILDVGSAVKSLGTSKVQVFSSEDKKFIKTEMNREIALMKQKLKDNRAAIDEMVEAQKKLTSGSKEELEMRKKILEAYKTQAKLGKDLGSTQNAAKMGGGMDKSGGGILGSLMGFARLIPGLAAVATIGYAVSKNMQANDQYKAGAGNRVKLKGLGVNDEFFGSKEELASAGLSEQDMIQRRIEATSVLGRKGGTTEGELRKAKFERAFGLEGGTMTGLAGQLRGTMGGEGANDAQMKLQAATMAAGIEDALKPYLESATQLLSAINDNGTAQTAEMTGLFAQLTKDGQRTPELMAKTFTDINNAVKGASGEQSAFLQTAFANAGIGGGSLGGTKFAMESGGIMGLNKDELAKRGYNKDLLADMEKNGMFKGVGDRVGALSGMFQQAGGLQPGQSFGDIKNTDQMVGVNNLANSVFGTKGGQGFDALMMLEQVQKKKMTEKEFNEKLKEMQESKDPSVKRLDDINKTLAGQTTILEQIRDSAMEDLGKESVQIGNKMVALDTEGIIGVKNTTSLANKSGATDFVGDAAVNGAKSMNSGGMGGRAYGAWNKMKGWVGMSDEDNFNRATSDQAIIDLAKKKRDAGTGFQGMTDEQIEAKVKASLEKQRESQLTAEAIGKEVGKEVGKQIRETPIVNNVKMQAVDGKVSDKTVK